MRLELHDFVVVAGVHSETASIREGDSAVAARLICNRSTLALATNELSRSRSKGVPPAGCSVGNAGAATGTIAGDSSSSSSSAVSVS